MHYRILTVLCIATLLFIVACKEEPVKQSGIEEYFEDYEAPENKWGFIDTSGNMAIEPKYDDLRAFNDGLAIANYQGKWGFIDKSGNAIIDFKFRSAYPFKDGLARIQNFDKKYGFINSSDQMIILDTFDLVFDFSSGLARAQKGPNYGYIDKKGHWAIAPAYSRCSNFENGFAVVEQFGKNALIDTSGQFVISFDEKFNKLYESVDQVVRAKKGDQYYYIDLRQDNKAHGPYDKAIDFDGDSIKIGAVEENGRWKLIDRKFEEIASFDAQSMSYAGNSVWLINQNSKTGMIKADGTYLVESNYKMLYGFEDGMALFESQGYWGYLNQDGEVAIDAIFPLAWAFHEGFGRIISGGLIGYITKKGQLAFKTGFQDAHDFSEGLAHVQE